MFCRIQNKKILYYYVGIQILGVHDEPGPVQILFLLWQYFSCAFLGILYLDQIQFYLSSVQVAVAILGNK